MISFVSLEVGIIPNKSSSVAGEIWQQLASLNHCITFFFKWPRKRTFNKSVFNRVLEMFKIFNFFFFFLFKGCWRGSRFHAHPRTFSWSGTLALLAESRRTHRESVNCIQETSPCCRQTHLLKEFIQSSLLRSLNYSKHWHI